MSKPLEYLVMLPGPTNVPERILRAMYVPMINHRSDDFVELYEDCVEKTKKVFMTEGEAVCLSASGTGAVEASVAVSYTHLTLPTKRIV